MSNPIEPGPVPDVPPAVSHPAGPPPPPPARPTPPSAPPAPPAAPAPDASVTAAAVVPVGYAAPAQYLATPTTYGLPGYQGFQPQPRIHRSARHPIVLAAVAAIMLIGFVLNIAFTGGFPSNAPVELAFSGLLSFDLFLGIVALVILTIIFAIRRSARPPKIGGFDGLAIAGLACGVVALLGWLLLSGPNLIGNAITGDRGRYDGNVGGAVLAGIPWILAFVFGAIGVRRGANRLSNAIAIAAIACGVAVLIPVIAASFIYGLDLSD